MPYSNQNILLIDDHPLILMATKELVKGLLPGANITTASSLAEVIGLKNRLNEEFDAVISDLMVEDVTPERLIEEIEFNFPRSKLVFISAIEEGHELITQINTAGHLFLHKTSSYMGMAQGLREHIRVKESFDFYAQNEHRSNIQVAGFKPLTLRQAAIMEKLAEGKRNKEVAKDLGMSPDTVRAHIKEAYSRLGSNNRGAAIASFVEAKKLSETLHCA